jgi:hypothetical protein
LENFYSKQEVISQDQICNFYLQNVKNAQEGKPAADGSYKQDPIDYLKHKNMHADTIEMEGGPIPGNIIFKEINDGRPVIMKVDNAHYVMIYGYEGVIPKEGRISRSMEKQINFKFFIYDPIKPDDENNTIHYLAKTYMSNYEPGKEGQDLIINGLYLTKNPLLNRGGRKKRTAKRRKTHIKRRK